MFLDHIVCIFTFENNKQTIKSSICLLTQIFQYEYQPSQNHCEPEIMFVHQLQNKY